MLDRSVAPPAEAISKPKFPEYSLELLTSGARLFTINQGTQPVVMLEMVIPLSQMDHPETSYFLSKMLTEGTRSKTSEQIAEALEYYGSHLEAVSSYDHFFIRLYCLKRYFSTQLELVEELLTASVFPEREFEIIRNIRVQQLHQQQAKTSAVASQKFRESLFGVQHPYGHITTPEMTESLSLEAVKDFYAGAFRSVPTLFLTGSVGEAEVEAIRQLVARLGFVGNSQSRVGIHQQSSGGSFPWKNAVQTSIRMGGPTITRTHADIHALKVTMDLFGGFFGSRLMKNIREEKGLTYGIHASISHLQLASYWGVSTDVLKEKADLAISEIQQEIDRLVATPPSKSELETVTNYSKGKFLMSFDSAFNSLGMIRNLILAGQDFSFWEGLLQKLDTITPGEVSQTAAKYLKVDTIVKVG